MKPVEMSNEYLLFELASVEHQLSQLYAQKKDLLEEIAGRKERLLDKYRAGKIELRRGEDE